ncbi:MAG: SDR family oxidoreductase [Pseudomonadota bacterium]
MSKCLVTGAAGFIGSHIAETLIRRGDPVVVVDNLSTGRQRNLDHLKLLGGELEIMIGDLRDPEVCRKAVQGVEYVFHQAALGSVPKSVIDPLESHHSNVTATIQLLLACREAGVGRIVNAASSSAYGETPELPKRESMVPNPLSPYAVTKLAQEHYCHAFSASYRLETVSLRYFNVYGPRQDPDSQYAAVIPLFFKAFLAGKQPTIFGDGEQTRDFTYVADVVDANLKASQMKGARGEIFNIGGGKAVSINQLVRIQAGLVGVEARPVYAPPRPGDIKHSLADINRARSGLSFHPTTSLEVGLRKTLEWYRSSSV